MDDKLKALIKYAGQIGLKRKPSIFALIRKRHGYLKLETNRSEKWIVSAILEAKSQKMVVFDSDLQEPKNTNFQIERAIGTIICMRNLEDNKEHCILDSSLRQRMPNQNP